MSVSLSEEDYQCYLRRLRRIDKEFANAGVEFLEDVVKECRKAQTTVGHCDYWNSIKTVYCRRLRRSYGERYKLIADRMEKEEFKP